MHENRETSSLTARSQGSPAGKGPGRTTSTNGGEESDRVEVPMKQANKATERQAEAAEPAEGRTRTKENIGQDHTSPAQDGSGVSQGLAGVRQLARARKQERFTTVLHHLTIDLLRSSFQRLKKEAAPGVDGVRWRE
jgi:RNA-directed DNA polymerase